MRDFDDFFAENKELGELVKDHIKHCDEWHEGNPTEIFQCDGFPYVRYESGNWWFYDLLSGCRWVGGAPTVTSSSEWKELFKTLSPRDIIILWNAYRLAKDESEPYHETTSPVGYFLVSEYDENDPIDRMLGIPSWLKEDPSREARIRWYVRAARKGVEGRVAECVAYFWKDAICSVVDFDALAEYLSGFKYPPDSVLGLSWRSILYFEERR